MTTGTFPASCWASLPPSQRRKTSLQQQPQAAETKWWFTEDELSKIQEQMDKLFPNSNCSSKTISLRIKPDPTFYPCLRVHLLQNIIMFVLMLSFFVLCRSSITQQLNNQLSEYCKVHLKRAEDTLEIKPPTCKTNLLRSNLQAKPWCKHRLIC